MKQIKKYLCLGIWLILILPLLKCSKKVEFIRISSPNKSLLFEFHLDEKLNNMLSYSLLSNENYILKNSHLGLVLNENISLNEYWEILSVQTKRVRQKWYPIYGERSEILDHYEEGIFSLKQSIKPFHKLIITVRVYDEGIAFRYTIPDNDRLINPEITNEKTEFSFLQDHKAWVTYQAQGEYVELNISKINKECERPLTIIINDSLYVALGEAALEKFARMKFKVGNNKQNTLVTSLGNTVKTELPFSTPWRYVMVGNSPGELLENNYFILNLNEPNKIKNTSWIKPGKIIREVTLTTKGGIACIDFAKKHNLQYVEFDAGWYGNEYDKKSDASTITVDSRRSPGPLDLHHIIDYANQKGIGIILYVNRRALEKQIDEILPIYKKWGIKGLKYGFVNVGSQEWTSWLHDAVKKAADYQLMVDVHDEYRPTGFSRTYPNLMTQEGIRGDEESPSTKQTLTTLFTRMVAGAGDNTNCYFAPRVSKIMGGRAAQMAKAIMLYSPWQFLYWYDRPEGSPSKKGGAGASENIIQELPELEFYDQLPTVWDETLVLEGEIGNYATICRKNKDTWFVGSMTDYTQRKVEIPLKFLDEEKTYKAMIFFQNAENLKNNTVSIDELNVTQKSIISRELLKNSGLTIIIKTKRN